MKDEATVQAAVRLKASSKGWRLWRNNCGVAVDKRGVPVRYGLCNESKQMNQNLKSSDLIGIRPIVITPDMVGQVIGQFVAIECKHEDWKEKKDNHTQAQRRYLDMVNALGGYGVFITTEEQL